MVVKEERKDVLVIRVRGRKTQSVDGMTKGVLVSDIVALWLVQMAFHPIKDFLDKGVKVAQATFQFVE